MLRGISTGAITVVEDPVVISEGNVSETAKEKRVNCYQKLQKGTTGLRQTYTVIL